MNVTEVFEEARATMGSKGVFGAPYEKNGITVIPAARIMGGAGGGEGVVPHAADGQEPASEVPTGSGGGFGMSGQPTGAFVIKGDEVRWLPAVDVNRMMFGFQVVMVVFFLAMRSIAKARAAAKAAPGATPV
jgi:uncharacterized spore protein YtfJ